MKSRILSLSVLATLAATGTAYAQAAPGQPIPRSDPNGVYCREYTRPAMIGGRQVSTYGTACQQPDGTWKIISDNSVPQQPQPGMEPPPMPEYLGPPVYTTPPQYVAPPVAYYYPAPVYAPYPYYGGGVEIGIGGGWHDGGWHHGYYRH